MSPAGLFTLALLITAGAVLSERIVRRVRHRRLRALAAEWRMNYSPADQFRLTPRVARAFPVPGAAKIRVLDLIYGTEQGHYRYVFTAEYTAGLVSGKRRVQRAASFIEPRDRGGDSSHSPLTLAPANLSLLEQYRKLAPVR